MKIRGWAKKENLVFTVYYRPPNQGEDEQDNTSYFLKNLKNVEDLFQLRNWKWLNSQGQELWFFAILVRVGSCAGEFNWLTMESQWPCFNCPYSRVILKRVSINFLVLSWTKWINQVLQPLIWSMFTMETMITMEKQHTACICKTIYSDQQVLQVRLSSFCGLARLPHTRIISHSH